MANAGAKRRVEENKKRLKLLQQIITVCAGLFLLLNLGRKSLGGGVGFWTLCGAGVTLFTQYACYKAIATMAEPVYSDSGELIDGGANLDMGGFCEYYHDLIYVAAFIQLASIITNKAWWAAALVPAYGSWLAWVNVLKPYYFAPKPKEVVETPEDKKKREKQERKAARGKVKYVR